MSTKKAVREARARLAERKRARDELAAQMKPRAEAAAAARARVDKVAKKHSRRPTITHLANVIAIEPKGLARLSLGYGADKLGTRKRDIVKAVEDGQKINGGSYGQEYSLRGLVPRIRYPSRAGLAAIKRDVAKRKRAEAALATAKQVELATFKRVFDEAERIASEVIVAALAEVTVALNEANALDRDRAGWRLPDLERHVRDAEAHLAFAASGADGPCNCPECAQQRREAEWQAQSERQRAARALDEAARAKAIAKAPKLRITCPVCGVDQIVPDLGTGEVDCTDESCGAGEILLAAIVSKRVAKATDIGPIEDESDDDDEGANDPDDDSEDPNDPASVAFGSVGSADAPEAAIA